MPELTTGSQVGQSPDAARAEWLARLKRLVADIDAWAGRSGWKTREITKAMKDSVLGSYRAPALLLQRETVKVILNPVSRFVPGADGAVDLYLMPAYDDIASLYLTDGAWRIHYVFHGTPAAAGPRKAEVLELSEQALVRVLDEIAARAT